MSDVSDVFVGWNPRFYIQQSDRTSAESLQQRGRVSYLALNEVASSLASEVTEVLHTLVGTEGEVKIHFVDHHRAHVAGAFFLSGFDESAFLVLDGFGENSTGMAGTIRPGSLSISTEYRTPHSLGAFYSTFADFLGFSPNSEEWKVMALAASGDSDRYYRSVSSLVRPSKHGFELDLSFFEHFLFFTPHYYSPKFVDVFGPPRSPGRPLEPHYLDLIAAAQRVIEETVFMLLTQLHESTQQAKLVVGGGTFMNSVCNGKILEQTPFREVFIGGSPDDSGVSVGSALHGAHFSNSDLERSTFIGHNYFGREYSTEEVRTCLESWKVHFSEVDDPSLEAARLLQDGNIIGWFQGGSEFGQRALGNRSILADATRPDVRDIINSDIKYREWFRPFGGAVPLDRQSEFFDLHGHRDSRFMECVVHLRDDWKGHLPGIVHSDGSSRMQSVARDSNARFYDLLSQFGELSGIPIVLNTSFNTRGRPLVESPEDAISCLFTSGLDALVIDRFLLIK